MVIAPDGLCFTTRRSPGYLLRRAAQLLVPIAEKRFVDEDLTLSQWIAIKLVRDGIADTSAGLSKLLGHNSGATTRMIDQMEARGLMTRCRRSDDRRVVTLELTPAGLAAANDAAPRMAELWSALLEDFTAEEVETMVSLLARLVERLEREEDGLG